MVALLWVLLILIPEGLGLFMGRELSLLFILGFPSISFLWSLLSGRKIAFPMIISLCWATFLILILMSSIFSSGSQNVFIILFYNVSLFLAFIYFYNHQDLAELFIQILIGIGLFFCFYTSIIYLGLNYLGYSPLPIPSNGYQFVFSRFGSHNHLGDLLVLAVIPVFYYYTQYKRVFLLVIGAIFSLFILGSYSRSAYLSLLVSLSIYIFWQWKKISRRVLFYLFSIIILLTSLIFIVVKDISSVPIIGDAHRVVRNMGLKDKEITAKRFEFLNQSIGGVRSKPLFGYGPGNFLTVSTEFTSYGTRTHSAHNIFLDTAAELGLPALGAFLLIIFLILKSQTAVPSLISLMILAFLTNSITDYTYRIYSFMFIFVVLSGLNYREKGLELTKKQLVVLCLVSLVVIIYPLYKM